MKDDILFDIYGIDMKMTWYSAMKYEIWKKKKKPQFFSFQFFIFHFGILHRPHINIMSNNTSFDVSSLIVTPTNLVKFFNKKLVEKLDRKC